MPTTTTTPKDLSDRALQDAVDYVAATPGAKTQIATRLAAYTGQNVTRQMVELWLHPQPEKRRVPTLGYAIALLVVVHALQDGVETPEPLTLTLSLKGQKPAKKTKTTTSTT